MNLPVSFSEKVKAPAAPGGTGYPHRISAGDLDKNFQYAALDAEPGYIEETSGKEGNKGRRLLLPPIPTEDTKFLQVSGGQLGWGDGANTLPEIPTSGTHVLGAVDGVLTWIATEDCEEEA
jgi:hypothetical protein